MKIFRPKHDNVPESPVRTLYGRKGNLLLAPLDVCILQRSNGAEEFRPPEAARLIAAPIQEHGDGRLGVIAWYEWQPHAEAIVNPVVTVQLAPSASVKSVEDLRVLASQVHVGDRIALDNGSTDHVPGVVQSLLGWYEYPDLTHRVHAYRVQFQQPVDRQAHGSAIRLEGGGLLGMLIATQNQPDGVCRALVYPA